MRSRKVLKPSRSERLVGERTNAMAQFSNNNSSNNGVSLTANEKLLESLSTRTPSEQFRNKKTDRSGRNSDPEESSVVNRELARNSRDWRKLMRRMKDIERHMANKV